MLITCTNCGTSYQVAAASLGPTGRSVRCARCKQMWFAANTEALATEVLADVAEAHRADLAMIAEAPPVADPPPPEQDFAPTPGMSPEAGPAEQAFGNDPGMAQPGWPEPAAQDEHQDEHQDQHQDRQQDDNQDQDASSP